jgi:hypothetical protein
MILYADDVGCVARRPSNASPSPRSARHTYLSSSRLPPRPGSAWLGQRAKGADMVRSGRLAFVSAITCASLAASVLVSPAAMAVPGLQLISFSSPHDSSANKRARAACPAGRQVVGAAASILNGQGQAILTGYRPVDGGSLSYVDVAAREDQTGYAGSWSLTAYALCALPVAGWQIVSATNVPGSPSNATVIANCPAPKRPLGFGGWIDNPGAGQVILNDTYVTSVETATGATGVEDEAGFAGIWSVSAYAICATPVPGRQVVTGAFPPAGMDSSSPKSFTLSCPAGKSVHGIGARINGSIQDTTLDDLVPAANLTSVTFSAFEDEDGEPGGWQLRGIVVCAT